MGEFISRVALLPVALRSGEVRDYVLGLGDLVGIEEATHRLFGDVVRPIVPCLFSPPTRQRGSSLRSGGGRSAARASSRQEWPHRSAGTKGIIAFPRSGFTENLVERAVRLAIPAAVPPPPGCRRRSTAQCVWGRWLSRGGRRVCHGAPATSAPVDYASRAGWGRTVRPPRRSAHRPGTITASAVRVVFGTRVVSVTLVDCPCRVIGPASGSRPRRLRRPASGSSTPFRQGCRRVRGDQHDRDARARKAVNGEGQAHG